MPAFTGGLARARELLTERFGHAAFRAHQVRVLGPLLAGRSVRAAQPVSLLAVDEAHCIVEWGNEFRPVYRRLGEYRYRLQRPPTIALTGSATPAARAEILHVLRLPQAELVVTSFDRVNLMFAVQRVSDDRARFAGIRTLIREADGHTIVYA